LRVQAGTGFVQEEDFGVVSDCAGDLDALSKAARELGRIGAGAFGEMELGEELVGAIVRLGAGEAKVKAVKVDVFEDRAGAVERVVLRHDPDKAPGDRRGLDNVDSCDADTTRGGQSASGADADGSGFPGAVGAEKTEEFALADAEIDAVDGDNSLLAVIDFLEGFDLDYH
jgi:hypothetical protein